MSLLMVTCNGQKNKMRKVKKSSEPVAADSLPPSGGGGRLPLPKYDINHLRQFVEAVECRKYVAAAESLHVVQSTISGTVKKLQDYLGVGLLRQGEGGEDEGWVPTPAGQVFYTHACEVLRAFDEAQRAVLAFEGKDSDVLRVGFLSSHVGLAVPALQAVMERFPGVHVRADDENAAHRLLERIHGGTMDVALIFEMTRTTGLHVREVAKRGFGLVVPNDPANAARATSGTPVDLDELRDARFVLLSTSTRTRKNLDKYFAERNFVPSVALEANGVATLLSMVQGGVGVTILPTLSGRQGLTMLPLTPDPPEQSTVLVKLATKHLSRAGEFFADEVCKRGRSWRGE
ncbi:MAG: LysR family transcriptional regulator [Polyangiaceae bacterium]